MATMITRGPFFEIWCKKTIPFSFCLCLPWINQLPFTKDAIRAEKIKVFEQLHNPTDDELKKFFIRGQYHSGTIEGKKDISYRSEPNVDPESTTETYASGTFFVDSDRFRGVPFFFRTGKRLTQKGTMVNVVFKQTDSIFGHSLQPNVLTIYIQPNEGFLIEHQRKRGRRKIQYRTDFL